MENEIQSSFPILKFTALARLDIEGIWHYLGEFGNNLSEKSIRQIIEKCVVLSKTPKLGRERNDLILNLASFLSKTLTFIIFRSKMVLKFTEFYIVQEITSKYLTKL